MPQLDIYILYDLVIDIIFLWNLLFLINIGYLNINTYLILKSVKVKYFIEKQFLKKIYNELNFIKNIKNW
jgi:hypothetical protein